MKFSAHEVLVPDFNFLEWDEFCATSASSCNSPTLPYTPHFHPFPIASILPVPFHILHANCPTLPRSHFELPTDNMTTRNAEQLGLQLSSFTPSTRYQLPLHKIQNKHFQHLAPPLSSTSPKLVRTPHSIAIMLRVTNNRHCTSILKIATSSWKIVLSLATSTYL